MNKLKNHLNMTYFGVLQGPATETCIRLTLDPQALFLSRAASSIDNLLFLPEAPICNTGYCCCGGDILISYEPEKSVRSNLFSK